MQIFRDVLIELTSFRKSQFVSNFVGKRHLFLSIPELQQLSQACLSPDSLSYLKSRIVQDTKTLFG